MRTGVSTAIVAATNQKTFHSGRLIEEDQDIGPSDCLRRPSQLMAVFSKLQKDSGLRIRQYDRLFKSRTHFIRVDRFRMRTSWKNLGQKFSSIDNHTQHPRSDQKHCGRLRNRSRPAIDAAFRIMRERCKLINIGIARGIISALRAI